MGLGDDGTPLAFCAAVPGDVEDASGASVFISRVFASVFGRSRIPASFPSLVVEQGGDGIFIYVVPALWVKRLVCVLAFPRASGGYTPECLPADISVDAPGCRSDFRMCCRASLARWFDQPEGWGRWILRARTISAEQVTSAVGVGREVMWFIGTVWSGVPHVCGGRRARRLIWRGCPASWFGIIPMSEGRGSG